MKRVKDPLPRQSKRYAACMEALAKDHVRWQHGLEVILTFNMNLQDDFLADFCKDFRTIDTAHDGTHSACGLKDLVNTYATVEGIKDGSQAYNTLDEAKVS